MIRAILFMAAFISASAAVAAQPVKIVVYQLDAGYYVVQNGEIVPFPPNGPIVPPTPPIVPVSQFAKAVTDEVAKIPASDKRHTAALKLTATYQMLAGQVSDGKIHPANAVQAADLICPIALGTDKAAWGGVFSVVNAAVGKAGTPEATAAIFTEAADAVLSTVPATGDGDMAAAAERYGFDWDAFLAFLMELMKILLPLIIS